jgi:hypothetical protein
MKKISLFLFFITSSVAGLLAQPTTAYDFERTDCNGNTHHLFADLDSGYVVIMEYFMLSCSPCVVAGNALEPMFKKLKATCSNKIKFYHFAFNNTYTCTQINNWVNTNNFTSIPVDSGAKQVGYYGGMGMPTVAIAAGKTHKLFYSSSSGFPSGDTTAIADSVRKFFGCMTTSIKNNFDEQPSFSAYPSPASDRIRISFNPSSEGRLHLHLVSLTGQCIQTIFSETISAGAWSKTLVLPPLPGGLYFLKGDLNGSPFVRKISIEQ